VPHARTRSGNALKRSIIVGAGKESKSDARSNSE